MFSTNVNNFVEIPLKKIKIHFIYYNSFRNYAQPYFCSKTMPKSVLKKLFVVLKTLFYFKDILYVVKKIKRKNKNIFI
jgi:hypothetical protein